MVVFVLETMRRMHVFIACLNHFSLAYSLAYAPDVSFRLDRSSIPFIFPWAPQINAHHYSISYMFDVLLWFLICVFVQLMKRFTRILHLSCWTYQGCQATYMEIIYMQWQGISCCKYVQGRAKELTLAVGFIRSDCKTCRLRYSGKALDPTLSTN